MMAAIFATLTLALLLGWRGHDRAALASIAACLILAIYLFLWEIYSPDYGFRMPWITTDSPANGPVAVRSLPG